MNEQLQAMRWLMRLKEFPRDKDPSLTPVQNKCLELYLSNFTEFMRQKTLLEKADLLRRKEALALKRHRPSKKVEKDEGTEKAIAVYEKWLQDYERENNATTDQGQTAS